MEDLIGSVISKNITKFKLENGLVMNHSVRQNIFVIQFQNLNFELHIIRYYHEIYAQLYKVGEVDKAVSLFNLVQYFERPKKFQKHEFYANESNLEQRYLKQIENVFSILSQNLIKINDFFDDFQYERRFAELEAYVIQKNPNLFKRIP